MRPRFVQQIIIACLFFCAEPSVFALDKDSAAHNLTVLEYARQQALICEKTVPGAYVKYQQWRAPFSAVEQDSLRALEQHAVHNNLDSREKREFMLGVQELIHKRVASEGDIAKSNCANFEADLSFYIKQFKK